MAASTPLSSPSASSARSVLRTLVLAAGLSGPYHSVAWSDEGILGPIGVYGTAGATGNYWLPRPVTGAELTTRGYKTAYANLRVTLFDRLVLERLRYEATSGSAPVERDLRATDTGAGGVTARLLDTVLALYAFEKDDFVIGPGGVVRSEQYEAVLDPTEALAYIHSGMSVEDDLLILKPNSQNLVFTTSFTEILGGMGIDLSEVRDQGPESVIIGLGKLRFSKPWSIPEVDEALVLYSDFEGYGFGIGYSAERELSSDRRHLMLEGDFFAGEGSIRLARGLYLEEHLGDDLALVAVVGGGQVGIRQVVIDRGLKLHVEGAVKGDVDWFVIGEKDGEEVEVNGDSKTLTWDIRGGASFRLVLSL